MNDCFAYHMEWDELTGFFKKNANLCCALSSEWARAYKEKKICGTLICPFYKPKDKIEKVRISDELWERV